MPLLKYGSSSPLDFISKLKNKEKEKPLISGDSGLRLCNLVLGVTFI